MDHEEAEPRPRRWPHWVYDQGQEPDPRFTLANERTFLAWLRTSLALLAVAIAVDVFDLGWGETPQKALAAVMVGLSATSAVHAWRSWARTERALRHRSPLPAGRAPLSLVIIVIGVAIFVLVAIIRSS